MVIISWKVLFKMFYDWSTNFIFGSFFWMEVNFFFLMAKKHFIFLQKQHIKGQMLCMIPFLNSEVIL